MADVRYDIARYHKGELSPAEMHALEKAALDDPFLADALEGMSDQSAEAFKADLDNLHHLLQARIQPHRRRGGWFTWPMRIAAGLLVLAAATFIFFIDHSDSSSRAQEDVLAMHSDDVGSSKKQAPSVFTDTLADQSKAISPEKEVSNFAPSAAPAASRQNPAGRSRLKEPEHVEILAEADRAPQMPAKTTQPLVQASKPADEVATETDLAVREEEAFDEVASQASANKVTREEAGHFYSADTVEIDDIQEIVTEPARQYARSEVRIRGAKQKGNQIAPAASQSFAMMDKAAMMTVKGKVVDADDGLPIPGVNVSVAGMPEGAITDLDGSYAITVLKSDENLVFSFIGMETKEVSIPAMLPNEAAANVNVQLYEDVSQLSEVVVVGYTDQATFEGTRWEIAEPEGGRKAYKEYLEKEMVYPEVAIENEVEGKVSVQFTVQPNGQLTDFRVVKSLGYGCDEEVIRLIRQGPQWNPTKRDNDPVVGKGKVKMRFSLSKDHKD